MEGPTGNCKNSRGREGRDGNDSGDLSGGEGHRQMTPWGGGSGGLFLDAYS